jgi:D-glycerate 3-kinase
MVLAREIFAALEGVTPTAIPRFDKSLFNGQGDRVPLEHWQKVNGPQQTKPQIIIFEGWCVGFKALAKEKVQEKHENKSYKTLSKHKLDHLLFINHKLEKYDVMTKCFDAFIHIDAEETDFVFEWRLQQGMIF